MAELCQIVDESGRHDKENLHSLASLYDPETIFAQNSSRDLFALALFRDYQKSAHSHQYGSKLERRLFGRCKQQQLLIDIDYIVDFFFYLIIIFLLAEGKLQDGVVQPSVESHQTNRQIQSHTLLGVCAKAQ